MSFFHFLIDAKVTLSDGSPLISILVANKVDMGLPDDIRNSIELVAKENEFDSCYTVSAKENIGIEELFNGITQIIKTRIKYDPPVKNEVIDIKPQHTVTPKKSKCCQL
jgi:50S ribosomal subunit-associated GTPase HflX